MPLTGDKEYFKGIGQIPFEGKESDNPFAFKYYNPEQLVAGKTMREHFKFAVAYWHTFCGQGGDPFGPGTQNFEWDRSSDPIQAAKDKADAAIEFITKMGFEYFCSASYRSSWLSIPYPPVAGRIWPRSVAAIFFMPGERLRSFRSCFLAACSTTLFRCGYPNSKGKRASSC